MLLKVRRIAVVLTAALTLAAASIPTNAEAGGFLLGPALVGAVGWGGGGPWGGGGWQSSCGCRVWVPPPPCCCCGGYGGGGYQ
jgi:hypothetical protein